MIVLDTSGVIAAVDEGQRLHGPARRALESDPGPFVLSPFALAEVDCLLATRVGVEAGLAFLREVVAGDIGSTYAVACALAGGVPSSMTIGVGTGSGIEDP